MLSDIEIAQQAKMRRISTVAAELGLGEEEYEPYGHYKAKVALTALEKRGSIPDGKLIYVTAITPTPAGEGKTCTAVGLTQALGRLGKKAAVALREPSLGPTFGVKGGAAGGGYAQVLPMDEINLHFTGDLHAVTAAHNLLAAVIENHLHHGNELGIDPKRVLWKRVLDISDRQLRQVIVGVGDKSNGVMRESGFEITAASEIMAILCLATDLNDLKQRLGSILVAYTYQKTPVFVRDLGVVGALAVLLKEAIKPNLVQTLEGQPAFIHGGPFANIAHGNNSILATKLALKLADYVVTEGGFASDLGAEKFFDLVAPRYGLKPAVAVLVASVRALKNHGGVAMEQITVPDPAAVERGVGNLAKHLSNLRDVFGLPVVVALNKFPTDDPQELAVVLDYCRGQGVPAAVSEVVAHGGAGGIALAQQVLATLENVENRFAPLYGSDTPLEEKIKLLATKVYGADGVNYTPEARKAMAEIKELGFDHLPVCMAKTQMSLSDNPRLKGAPQGWELTVRDLKLSTGAGFIVVLAGNILTMPGLPKTPAAQKVDLLPDGRIVGLF
ncbi:formate--tetrahydrofolate ligase [Capillibacterium thermochitinicola]|uniref:Formate--tetrahydrofolate ligase n=1 Tax=Capillibacterium thermochitinicola TaxID=2699427 RepID=A0A8J6I0J6_9FIRM|nr:formate--tetrahydrofolate ligase [Capillibacterium thermochitinicola]MBA2132758.1 formate--tetrahydrofolate ligase [Capillibacterium thermochitinicola]